jgi:hypothetical protein
MANTCEDDRMHSPALAIAWQLWRRHRWGLAAVLAYLLGCSIVFPLLPAGAAEEKATHGFLCSGLFVFALLYVTGVFAYGMDSRLEVRESGFPARMFTLPLRTSALVGWPMLQGMTAVALLWLAWAYFVLRPSGIEVPLGMTAVLAAAVVSVLQALLWSPFGLPWLRVLAAALALPLMLMAPVYGPEFGVPESALLGLYAALVPAAYTVAYTGVARARYGDNPEWRGLPGLLPGTARRDQWPRRPFPSPARAQLWIEWRRHAPSFLFPLGGYLVLFLPSYLVWAQWGGGDRIMLLLIFPASLLVLAPIHGFSLGRAGEAPGNRYLLSSFTATRPVTSAALVAAKLKVAALATLAAWALVILAAAVGMVTTGAYADVPGLWERLLQGNDVWKIAATALLAAAGLFLITWKMLINNLFITLTGRAWIERGIGLAIGIGLPLAFIVSSYWVGDYPGFAEALREWLKQPEFLEALRNKLTWGAGGIVLLKLTAGAVVLRALVHRGLLEERTMAKLLALWLLLAGGLFTLAFAVVPGAIVPVPLLACGVVLTLPLARVAAAPLALAWNRHR